MLPRITDCLKRNIDTALNVSFFIFFSGSYIQKNSVVFFFFLKVKIKDYGKEKRIVISIAFCDFALWNSDHRNLGLVFPKFLFFWAEWNA